MTITYHWDEREVMTCSFCNRPALVCHLYAKEPCVERAALVIVQSAASGVYPT